jgi:hypothetical protein
MEKEPKPKFSDEYGLEDVVKRLMKELKEMGSNNEGEALRQEAEDVFREDLMAELTDRYVQKHLSDEKIKVLKNVELTDEKYQEIIDKIFGK